MVFEVVQDFGMNVPRLLILAWSLCGKSGVNDGCNYENIVSGCLNVIMDETKSSFKFALSMRTKSLAHGLIELQNRLLLLPNPFYAIVSGHCARPFIFMLTTRYY